MFGPLVHAGRPPPALAGVLGGCVWVPFVVSSLFCRLGYAVSAVALGFRPAPHLSWLGLWDVRGCVRAPPAPRRSRFRCAVWACVLGSGFRLRPATLWGGVGVRVCLCARPAWSPAPPGWGCCAGVWVWCRAPPLLAGASGRVCVCARPACSPPFLAGVCCVGVRAGLGSRLCPAFLGWVVGVCVRLCVCPACPGPSWGAACGAGVCRCCRFMFFFGGGRVVFWLCGVGCWLSRSRVSWSLSPHRLSSGLRCWLFFFVPAWCVSVCFGCPFSRWAAAPGLVLPVLARWSPCAPWGILSSVPSGWGVWPPLAVLVGGLMAVGRSRAPPPVFFWGGDSACSSLCLSWAGARTGRHSVWSSGLLFVVAFSLAVSRPHGSGWFCTRWARRPFLPG